MLFIRKDRKLAAGGCHSLASTPTKHTPGARAGAPGRAQIPEACLPRDQVSSPPHTPCVILVSTEMRGERESRPVLGHQATRLEQKCWIKLGSPYVCFTFRRRAISQSREQAGGIRVACTMQVDGRQAYECIWFVREHLVVQ